MYPVWNDDYNPPQGSGHQLGIYHGARWSVWSLDREVLVQIPPTPLRNLDKFAYPMLAKSIGMFPVYRKKMAMQIRIHEGAPL